MRKRTRAYRRQLKRSLVDSPSQLSPREHDVAKLILEGYSNKLIAGALGISDHTAKFHVTNVIARMSAHTRVDAAVKYARWLDALAAKKAVVAQEKWFADQQDIRYEN